MLSKKSIDDKSSHESKKDSTDHSDENPDLLFENEIEKLLKEHDKIKDISNDLDFFEELQADHDKEKQNWQNKPEGVKYQSNGTKSSIQEEKREAIPNIESGASIDTFKIRNYSVNPIDLSGAPLPENHEKAEERPNPFLSNLSKQKRGIQDVKHLPSKHRH